MPLQRKCSSVAIVGGGIAGITFAAILSKMENPPNIYVFERDSREKDQGTGFDIRNEGQKILKQAGVFHKYYEFSREGSDITRLYKPDKDNPAFVKAPPKLLPWLFPPEPESNRHLLREALIESAGEKITIHFSHIITDIIQNENQAEIFGKKSSENHITSLGIFDLVVDSSGFGSKLRNYRIDDGEEEIRFKNYYTGITLCHGLINNPDVVCDPKIIKKLGEGSMMCFTNGIGLGLQRYGASKHDKRTSFYYFIPLEDISTLSNQFNIPKKTIFHEDKETLDKVKEWLHDELVFHNFSKDYFSVINNIDAISIRPLMQHPQNPNFKEDMDLPLILIGDSIHAMPIYTGSGGNLALADASDLADYIIQNNGFFDIKELRNLEKRFIKRAIPIMTRGNSRKDYFIVNDKKYRNGEKVYDNGLRGAGFKVYLLALIFTCIYYLECFFGIR